MGGKFGFLKIWFSILCVTLIGFLFGMVAYEVDFRKIYSTPLIAMLRAMVLPMIFSIIPAVFIFFSKSHIAELTLLPPYEIAPFARYQDNDVDFILSFNGPDNAQIVRYVVSDLRTKEFDIFLDGLPNVKDIPTIDVRSRNDLFKSDLSHATLSRALLDLKNKPRAVVGKP